MIQRQKARVNETENISLKWTGSSSISSQFRRLECQFFPVEFVPRHRLHDNRLFKAYQQRHFGAGLRAGRLITRHLCCEVPLLIAPTRTVERLRFVWPTRSYEQKKAQLITWTFICFSSLSSSRSDMQLWCIFVRFWARHRWQVWLDSTQRQDTFYRYRTFFWSHHWRHDRWTVNLRSCGKI